MTEYYEVPSGVTLFDTAEEAALAQWSHTPGAGARVVEVQPGTDSTSAWVVLQLGDQPSGFHDQDIVTCVRTPDGRWWSSGSTGASSGD